MLKEMIKRASLGFCFGILFQNVIFVLQSALYGQGYYLVATPDLLSLCGTEFNAVLFQLGCTGFMGLLFSASTLIFTADRFSLAQATALHFLLITPTGTAIGWYCNWIHRTSAGLAVWLIRFIVIYVIIWVSMFMYYRKKTREINEELSKSR